MRPTSKQAIRKRLVKAVSRPLLDELSGLERPWNSDRANIETVVLNGWTDETRDEILAWLKARV